MSQPRRQFPADGFPVTDGERATQRIGAVKIPTRMAKLPRDARGYPVPVGVLLDKDGRPHFTINDTAVHYRMVTEDRCGICGTPLLRDRWFIGGPLSAFAKGGIYIDPPTHNECARYALQVCPYLAAPSYTKRIDAGTLDMDKLPDGIELARQTMIENRPDPFVAVLASGQQLTVKRDLTITLRPNRPYLRIEFWSKGKRLGEAEAAERLATYFNEMGVVPSAAKVTR